jgi:hypothetical protein
LCASRSRFVCSPPQLGDNIVWRVVVDVDAGDDVSEHTAVVVDAAAPGGGVAPEAAVVERDRAAVVVEAAAVGGLPPVMVRSETRTSPSAVTVKTPDCPSPSIVALRP